MDPRLSLGIAADFVSGQRILSPIPGCSPDGTPHDQAVFTDSFIRQSKLRQTWFEHVSPSSSPHLFKSSFMKH
jgi:hypothetical protein